MASTTPTKQSPAPKDAAQPEELENPERLARTVFVGNVLASTKRKELKRLFKPFGEVEAVRLRGVIAANPKLPKRTALLARRMHKDCDTILAYVVFKKPSPGLVADPEAASADGQKSDAHVSDSDVEVSTTNAESQLSSTSAGGVKGPTEEVIRASRALNLTILNGKHLRVNPAWHTRGPLRQSVFLGNLPFDVTEEELILLFQNTAEEAGSKLLGVRVTRDKETGMGRGIGYASFDDELGVRAVMNLAGSLKIRDRVLRLERASKEQKRNTKTAKRNAKRESSGDQWTARGSQSQDRRVTRKRNERSGERVTRKIRKERSEKKVKTKVKHAARKARQAEAAAVSSRNR